MRALHMFDPVQHMHPDVGEVDLVEIAEHIPFVICSYFWPAIPCWGPNTILCADRFREFA
jgi:hypothetical protein